MADLFRVMDVPKAAPLSLEQMGSKEKFWAQDRIRRIAEECR